MDPPSSPLAESEETFELWNGTVYSISKTCPMCSDVVCQQSKEGRDVDSGNVGETPQHNSTPQDDRRTSLRSTAVAPPHSPRVVEEVLQDSTKEAQPLRVRAAGSSMMFRKSNRWH